MRALSLTASRSVPVRESFGTGTIGTAREMSLRRRSNVWHQRRAQRVRCMPGLGSRPDALPNGSWALALMKTSQDDDGLRFG